jgi:hypothetical protein
MFLGDKLFCVRLSAYLNIGQSGMLANNKPWESRATRRTRWVIVNWYGALVCAIETIAHGRARGQEQGVEVKSLPRSLSRDAPPVCRRARFC